MIRRLKRTLLLSVAVVTVLACVTAAVVMAAQPSAKVHTRHHGTRHGGPLISAAGYLGLTTAQLRSDLQSGKSLGQIANATAGKSEAGLIQALEAADRQKLAAVSAQLPRRIAAEIARVGGPPVGPARGARRHGLRARTLSTAAGYLGVSAAQLRSDLRSGMTLAKVANATTGKSEAGLIQALVAATKTALAKQVAAGRITQAQANQVAPKLLARVTAEVNRAPRQHAHAAKG
ncbi:MAG TPA: hypothetical protein VGX72_03505 [Solirubrobacteraceae bacterium]|jgi:hypothetical protein|nr:hypothetical protein [Solirubrobacteraceae bacterium]